MAVPNTLSALRDRDHLTGVAMMLASNTGAILAPWQPVS